MLMRGIFVPRRDRRTVARAYAAAAYRRQRGMPQLAESKYSHYRGKPINLNEELIEWVAMDPQESPK